MRVFCDDWEQASHGGELVYAVEAGAARAVRREVARRRARRPRRGPAERRRDHGVRLDRARDPGPRDRARRARGGRRLPICRASSSRARRAGSKSSSSGGRSPRIARATRSPQARPEDVAVPGVAAGDPDAVPPRHGADEGQPVGRVAPDAGPAVGDRGAHAGELARRAPRAAPGRLSVVSSTSVYSVCEARVALAAEHEPAVGKLVPVVVAGACVVRAPVEALGQRLGDEHLAAGRRARARAARAAPRR